MDIVIIDSVALLGILLGVLAIGTMIGAAVGYSLGVSDHERLVEELNDHFAKTTDL